MSAVLVTGAAGGLGAAVVELFADRGWTVYAADVVEPTVRARVVPLVLDVTSDESVAAAVASVPALDCVINFAGVLGIGPLMDIPAERFGRVLDINVVGTHRVNRAFFGLVHASGGRIINISSETGWQRALPMNGPYATSKHAIEAYSDALRRELMFVGVDVVVIQPGPFRTAMTGGIEAAFQAATVPGSPFERLARKVGRMAAGEQAKAHDPAVLAEVIWQAATAAKPKARYSVKPDPARTLMHRLPTSVVDRLLKKTLG
ncbi:short-chain dehydrogenase/reductase [Nocardioides baekrokdamisoli]|uniref:Short-chain dehydrogenase/reductase n=1 Tax=Nocardioides baekrokdamisoli TaxID=1804624 RepID=A0A3G9IXK7_9ACTN|nr:SDR family NAD(P)-dependent oxidoreductase [Nocardioides baekrokdamisoli]BBH18431.1 short-chain dehydrogenase/reductase [Nocardioides baekrokdamisoli]